MKRLFAIVVVLALIIGAVNFTGVSFTSASIELPVDTGSFSLQAASGSRIPYSYTFDTNNIINKNGWLFMGGCETTCVPGMPVVPTFLHREKINDSIVPGDFVITNTEWKTQKLPKLEAYHPKTWNKLDTEIAHEDWVGNFPSTIGTFKVESGFDGKYLTLAINPVVADFSSNELHILERIDLALEYKTQNAYSISSTAGEMDNDAVILTPLSLMSAAQMLAKAQEDDGYAVEVISVEDIASSYSPQEIEPEGFLGPKSYTDSQKEFMQKYDYELARKIRKYFEERINKVDYVTILGDGELVPASFYSTDSYSYYEYDRYIPTDLFYASPDLDTVPNFAVGRIPARNLDEAIAAVEKLNGYRKSLSADWFHKMKLGGGDPFNGGFEGEIECQALVDMGILDGFEVEKLYKTRDKFGGNDLKDALSDEVGFIYTVNHGSGESLLAEPGEVTTEDILALPKRNKLPILLTPACTNGMFDATVVDQKLDVFEGGDGMSFGQSCILSPGGPAAYFGGSRINYAGINWTIEGGVVKLLPFGETDRILQEVMNSYHNWADTLGQMQMQAYKKYIGIGSGSSLFQTSSKTLMAFVFFGDPTIKLPSTPGGSPHRIPEIDLVNAPMRDFGVAALPILSIVDPNTLQTKTDAEWINYEVLKLDSDYEIITDWTRIEPEAERTFSLMLEPDDKTLWQARLELPNLSEIWIYYYSAAHYDIGIESNRQFFISKPKPKEHFLFTVFNDGIKKAEDISVYLKVDGKNYGPKRKIKELESGYYKTVYFSVSGLPVGDHTIEIETSFAEKDQFEKDNTFERELVITPEETAKAAVLISYFFNRNTAKQVFELDKYNKTAKGFEGKPTEIALVGSDSYWAVLFGSAIPDIKSLGADSVILTTPNCTNPYIDSSVSNLSNFYNNGGSIIGFGTLQSDTNAPLISALYDFFGINPEAKIEYRDAKDNFELKATTAGHSLLRGVGDSILVDAIALNDVDAASWDDVIIDEDAAVAAKTADGRHALISNGRNTYLSFVPDFSDSSHIRLLHNIITTNLEPRPDAFVSLSGVVSKPAIPEVNQEYEVVVTVRNIGNTDLEDTRVSIEELKLEQTVKSIPKGESRDVAFKINSGDKPGIQTATIRVFAENDVDNDNNTTSLRIKIAPKRQTSNKSVIDEIDIVSGAVLPRRDTIIGGKATPGSVINISGNIGRANDSGEFVIPIPPTTSNKLTLSAKSPDGTIEEKDIWCSFEQGGNIGCAADEMSFVVSSNYIRKIENISLKLVDGVPFLNLTDTADYLGLSLDFDDNTYTLLTDSVIYGIGEKEIVKSIGVWSEKIQPKHAVSVENGVVYISADTLAQIDFAADFDTKTSTLLVAYPKERNTNTVSSFSLQSLSPTSDIAAYVPSEADYGKPKLVSFGNLDGEVTEVSSFRVTSKKLYLWTSRGIEEWSLDGEFIDCKGFPPTLASDMDYFWDDLYYPDSYGSYIGFHIGVDGGIIFFNRKRIVFYDRDWKLIQNYEPYDSIVVSSVRQDNDGNIYYIDEYSNCHMVSPKGKPLGDFEFIGEDGERIDSFAMFDVTPKGDIITVTIESDYFGWDIKNWSISKYDNRGKLVKTKIFDIEGSEDSESVLFPPDTVISDRDGTFWLFYNSWTGNNLRHWDEDFDEISSKILEIDSRYSDTILLGTDGRFYILGAFFEKVDTITKQYHMMILDNIDVKNIVPKFISTDSNRNLKPGYLVYDNDGNLLAQHANGLKKFDRMGSFVDDIAFVDTEGKKASVSWFTIGKKNIYTVARELWSHSYIGISDLDYNIHTEIPLVVKETKDREEFSLYPYIMAVDEKAQEIFVLDSSEINVVNVIPLYTNPDDVPEKLEIIRSFAPKGIGVGKVNSPKYMLLHDDKLFILDYAACKIVAYSKDGKFLYEFGGKGTTPGKMQAPYSMSIDDNGLIWIVDGKLSKFLIYGTDGTFVTSLGGEGNYTPYGTIEEYRSDPFTMLCPWEAAVTSGQIAIFDYCHGRLVMLNSLESTTNMNLTPPAPVLSMFDTQTEARTRFLISNSGPGTLEGTVKCEADGVTIEPAKFNGNLTWINVTLDVGQNRKIPEFVFVTIESNVGKIDIKLPIRVRRTEFVFRVGSAVASGANGVIRLDKAPGRADNTHTLSTSDIDKLSALTSVVSKSNKTVYYTYKNRSIGFFENSDIAKLRIDEDEFDIKLKMSPERLPDGSVVVPLDVIASFIRCEVIEEDGNVKVVTRN